eukprot:5476497-Prymnesium_polylepis.1
MVEHELHQCKMCIEKWMHAIALAPAPHIVPIDWYDPFARVELVLGGNAAQWAAAAPVLGAWATLPHLNDELFVAGRELRVILRQGGHPQQIDLRTAGARASSIVSCSPDLTRRARHGLRAPIARARRLVN